MTAVETTFSKRNLSIDILRGIVMLLMALDHSRFFFSDFKYDPTNLQYAGTALFLTRWITNFCAPVFVLLSGTSAFFSLKKTGSKKQASFKLLTRGIWLIFLEITLVRLGWTFDFNYSHIYLQVIWAIGCSMIALSALIFLPQQVILAIGLIMIFGHNALDGIHPPDNAILNTLWRLMHVSGPVTYGNGNTLFILYPLIPWIGIMAVGYCMGQLFMKEDKQQRNTLLLIGIFSVILFIALRSINLYGDPQSWQTQHIWRRTILSFINCTKYPPSLLFLLSTLGPAFILLPFLKKVKGGFANILLVYGRVPMFFYLLHIYLIHGMAVTAGHFIPSNNTAGLSSHTGFSLPIVYTFWLTAILILYFPCRRFMKIKTNSKKWWLSYL